MPRPSHIINSHIMPRPRHHQKNPCLNIYHQKIQLWIYRIKRTHFTAIYLSVPPPLGFIISFSFCQNIVTLKRKKHPVAFREEERPARHSPRHHLSPATCPATPPLPRQAQLPARFARHARLGIAHISRLRIRRRSRRLPPSPSGSPAPVPTSSLNFKFENTVLPRGRV